MEVNIHEIIDYYAKANVTLAGAFIEHRKLSGGYVIDRRTNPFYGGIIVPMAGRACISLNGKPYITQPGMVLHAGPDMQLNIEILDDKPWQIAVIHYKIFANANEIDKFPLFKNHFSFLTGESAKIPDLIQQIFQIQSIPGTSAMFKAKRLFINFIGELFDSLERYTTTDSTVIIDQVMEYIRQNYAEPLSIAQIATHFRLDRRKLATLFKHHVGMTPSNYLLECRILKAKELLHTYDCPINQVSEWVGYSDSLYFSKIFKKKIGISPSEYRGCV